MLVQHPDSALTYMSNGSTSTAYPVSFQLLLNSDIKVSNFTGLLGLLFPTPDAVVRSRIQITGRF